MRFRPSRAIASALLRFLGHESQQGAALDFDSVVVPTFPLVDPFPGLFPGPVREVWAGSSTHVAVAGQTAQNSVWAAPSTFSTQDTRKPAGIWVLDWAISYVANVVAEPPAVEWGISSSSGADPGPGNVPGVITTLGGQDPATVSVFADRSNQRSPRAQYSSDTKVGLPAGPTPFWPGSRNSTRGSNKTSTYPIYVAPGLTFHVLPGVGDLNKAFNLGIMWVEAEEKPVQQVSPP